MSTCSHCRAVSQAALKAEQRFSTRCADKPPLYFQHEGHSRTIVGVEWLHNPRKDSGPLVHLLVLDPSQGTSSLEKALRTKEGWQVRAWSSLCLGSGVCHIRVRGSSGPACLGGCCG